MMPWVRKAILKFIRCLTCSQWSEIRACVELVKWEWELRMKRAKVFWIRWWSLLMFAVEIPNNKELAQSSQEPTKLQAIDFPVCRSIKERTWHSARMWQKHNLQSDWMCLSKVSLVSNQTPRVLIEVEKWTMESVIWIGGIWVKDSSFLAVPMMMHTDLSGFRQRPLWPNQLVHADNPRVCLWCCLSQQVWHR